MTPRPTPSRPRQSPNGPPDFIMPFIDYLFSIGPIRKGIWKLWYPFLTRRLRGQDVLFLNYAFETEPPLDIPLAAEDEPDRACIQLYHHVGTQVNFHRKRFYGWSSKTTEPLNGE